MLVVERLKDRSYGAIRVERSNIVMIKLSFSKLICKVFSGLVDGRPPNFKVAQIKKEFMFFRSYLGQISINDLHPRYSEQPHLFCTRIFIAYNY